MSFDANTGTAMLAQVLSGRMEENNRRNIKVTVDFATVDKAYNLITNNFTQKIPPSDYTVCRHLTELVIRMDGEGDPHSHEYKTKYMKPGDRLLVVRVGNEFCVVDVIRSAEELHKKEAL